MEHHLGDGADIRLNIGAGETEWGDVRLDIDRTDHVTVVGDMHSLPFADNVCSEILLDNVIEHSPDTTGVLREIHRVLRPGGIVYIYVPYYNAHGAYGDLTHRSFFTEDTFNYYTEASDYDYYADFEFQHVSESFFYSKLLRFVPSERIKLKLGHMIGDLVLAMKVVLRKAGADPVEPSIDGWIQS
jgi:SAM-dependent methyltransferase